MKKCLSCGKDVNNKYCNVSCQNSHQNSDRSNKIYGKYMDFTINCNSCDTEFIIKEREKLHPKKDKYYCSRSCANKRVHTNETKKLIGSKLTKPNNNVSLTCKNCGNEYIVSFNKRKQESCSRSCNAQYRNKYESLARKAGKESAKIQSENRRSKNEIHFAELCKNHFNEVLTNEPLFNGWDADVIIEDIKVAVLWNGIWHYEKITESHSVEQVQNRDKIKISEIKKKGYIPYTIKDMGRENPSFVKIKFNEFIQMMGYW